jgi:hypothetical protein
VAPWVIDSPLAKEQQPNQSTEGLDWIRGGPSIHAQIRIQIAYVMGLGVRFRAAGKEGKGRTYIILWQ